MDLVDINPWWVSSKVQEEYSSCEKRQLFFEMAKYVKDKQIVVLSGLRRTGKTVTLHHLISLLLEKNPKESILYFNFDLFDEPIDKILEKYSEKTKTDFKKEKIFVFFDEVQKHHNWENELKVLYDNYSNIKFFISGSSSLFIEKKTKESLAGRTYSFTMQPLSFEEYLSIKHIVFDKKRLSLYENELKKHLDHYLLIGGFPELVEEKDVGKISRYVKEMIIDKIVYLDIPKAFKIEEPGLLESIFSIVSNHPGMVSDYDSISNDLNRDRKTISNYFLYLEKAFLVKKLYNYSKNVLTNEKKMKRFYPTSTAFAFLFNAEHGRIIETAVNMHADFKFFSRMGEKEIDFIQVNQKQILPVEVKYQENVKIKELKELEKFLEKNKLKKGIVITKNLEKKENFLEYIPLWKWLLSN